jgi:hypothetical protein
MTPNPNNRNPINNTTLIVAGIVVAAGVLLAAGIAAFAISQARPAPSVQVAEVPATVIVTRDVPAPTLAPLPTYTPQATFTPRPTETPVPTPTPAPTPTPLPIPEWRGMGSLATIEYTDSVIVERERDRGGVTGALLGKDRVVIMAVGRVVMGVDLNKITRNDITIQGTKITVRVPKVAVIAVELLPDRSRIFDAERSWLFSQYEGLETEALDEARRKLLEQAQTNPTMRELATTSARLQLTEFLRKLGYTDVVIEFVE